MWERYNIVSLEEGRKVGSVVEVGRGFIEVVVVLKWDVGRDR